MKTRLLFSLFIIAIYLIPIFVLVCLVGVPSGDSLVERYTGSVSTTIFRSMGLRPLGRR